MAAKAEFALILLAAGKSERMGGSSRRHPIRKPFLILRGKPLLEWSLASFRRFSGQNGRFLISQIVLVAHPDDLDMIRKANIPARYGVESLIAGGKLRQDSVRNGLKLVRPEIRYILIHDSARPFASADLIERVMKATVRHGVAIPAMKVSDTIKTVGKRGFASGTLDRSGLRAIQTPQGFRREILEDGYRALDRRPFVATDDAALAEAAGHEAYLAEGDTGNVKVTYPGDLEYVKGLFPDKMKKGLKFR